MSAVEKSLRDSPLWAASSRYCPLPRALYSRAFLTFFVLAADYALVPSLYNGSTLWAVGAFALLAYQGGTHYAEESGTSELPPLSAIRLATFAGLHAVLLLAGHFLAAELAAAGRTYSFAATGIAATKMAVLFPALVLFPRKTYQTVWRRFRAELLATLVILFTFLPHRVFVLAWPMYSKVVGWLVYLGSSLFVHGLGYLPGPDPVVTGPLVNVQMIFGCSGLGGIYLFDYLFGVVAVMEWPRLNKRRLLASYVLGLLLMAVMNVLRVILLVGVGNLVSPSAAFGKLHTQGGWILYTVAFLAFLKLTLGWMRESDKDQARMNLGTIT